MGVLRSGRLATVRTTTGHGDAPKPEAGKTDEMTRAQGESAASVGGNVETHGEVVADAAAGG